MYTRDRAYADVYVHFRLPIESLTQKVQCSQGNFPKKDGGFYSTKTFTDELLGYLKERDDTPDLKEKPFFAYYAFTAPHWPLQAEKEVRDKYKGMYDDGPDALRLKRLENLRKMGLISKDIVPHDLVNIFKTTLWDGMSKEEKEKSARSMEVVGLYPSERHLAGANARFASSPQWWMLSMNRLDGL